MTRLWLSGELIKVEADEQHNPLSFTAHGETHAIECIVQSWRIDTDWWAARLNREYFQVITTSGQMMIIYRDLVGNTWRLYRLYD